MNSNVECVFSNPRSTAVGKPVPLKNEELSESRIISKVSTWFPEAENGPSFMMRSSSVPTKPLPFSAILNLKPEVGYVSCGKVLKEPIVKLTVRRPLATSMKHQVLGRDRVGLPRCAIPREAEAREAEQQHDPSRGFGHGVG
jgi:hypothetical protein